MAQSLPQLKRAFLEDEFLTLSISGALQHSGTYKKEEEHNPQENEREKKERQKAQRKKHTKEQEQLQSALRSGLCIVATKYISEGGVKKEDHLKNIHLLVAYVNKSCSPFLKDDTLRLGIAQKALNLYLKYLWCVGIIKATPPHCPFDRTVLQDFLKLPDNWTEVNDDPVYEQWVTKAEKARDDAQCESLAEWELFVWNSSRPGRKAGCPLTSNSTTESAQHPQG
jgi:hypothetical protein